jgi:hypothetical protein
MKPAWLFLLALDNEKPDETRPVGASVQARKDKGLAAPSYSNNAQGERFCVF